MTSKKLQAKEGQVETETDSGSDSEVYGPSLPPALRATENRAEAHHPKDLEQDKVLGPPLPPGFKQDTDEDEGTYGPSLPPGYKQDHQNDSEEENSFGPPLPPGHQSKQEVSSEEEGEIIGPLPPSSTDATDVNTVTAQFEARAQRMKDKLEGKDEESAPQREDWMLELPDNYKSFGLGPRTFRKNARPENDDRSVWTDTPAQQEKKMREKLIAKARSKKEPQVPEISDRDRQIAQQVDAYNSEQRSQSLLDMHTSKRKRKMEEGEGATKERRPFDREIDLQVNRFDEAQRKNLIKKSAKLDTRFSHGKEKVFL